VYISAIYWRISSHWSALEILLQLMFLVCYYLDATTHIDYISSFFICNSIISIQLQVDCLIFIKIGPIVHLNQSTFYTYIDNSTMSVFSRFLVKSLLTNTICTYNLTVE